MYRKTAVALLAAVALTGLAGCDPRDSASRVVNVVSYACSLDAIGGQTDPLVHVRPGVVTFDGWALDGTTNTVPAQLQLVLKDAGGFSFALDAGPRRDRPDVVAFFKRDDLLKSGFHFDADLSALKKGVYAIALKMTDPGRVATCQIKKNLIID